MDNPEIKSFRLASPLPPLATSGKRTIDTSEMPEGLRRMFGGAHDYLVDLRQAMYEALCEASEIANDWSATVIENLRASEDIDAGIE